ncbi:AraC family transcriptional regulator [Mesorhizobium sp. BHbsci]
MQHNALARDIDRWSNGRDETETSIPGLTFFRRNAPTHPCICLVEPSIVVVAQGAKQMFLGSESYLYDSTRFLVTSLDMPAHTQVLEATPEKPCLGLTLKLDLRIMAELISQGNLAPVAERSNSRAIGVGTLTPEIVAPLERLVGLLDEPGAVPLLAPLVQREIHYRLLVSDQASRLWQIIAAGSQSHRIAMIIAWLKLNFASPLRVEDLSERAQMSASTFHQHFRELTSMSPLQYQKWLRLTEARRLMLNEHFDAASAAFKVGYESASQFSREYGRLYGAPPKRDVAAFKRELTHSPASRRKSSRSAMTA